MFKNFYANKMFCDSLVGSGSGSGSGEKKLSALPFDVL